MAECQNKKDYKYENNRDSSNESKKLKSKKVRRRTLTLHTHTENPKPCLQQRSKLAEPPFRFQVPPSTHKAAKASDGVFLQPQGRNDKERPSPDTRKTPKSRQSTPTVTDKTKDPFSNLDISTGEPFVPGSPDDNISFGDVPHPRTHLSRRETSTSPTPAPRTRDSPQPNMDHPMEDAPVVPPQPAVNAPPLPQAQNPAVAPPIPIAAPGVAAGAAADAAGAVAGGAVAGAGGTGAVAGGAVAGAAGAAVGAAGAVAGAAHAGAGLIGGIIGAAAAAFVRLTPAQFFLRTPRNRISNPHLGYQPAQPPVKDNRDGVQPFQRNNGQFRNGVFTEEQLLDGLDPTQRPLLTNKPTIIAFVMCLGGQLYFSLMKNLIDEMSLALSGIVDGADEIKFYRPLPEYPQDAYAREKYLAPSVMYAEIADPAKYAEVLRQGTTAVNHEIAFHPQIITSATCAWVLGVWRVTDKQDPDSQVRGLCSAIYKIMCEQREIGQQVDLMTQSGNANLDERTFIVADSLDGEFLTHDEDPLIVIYLEPGPGTRKDDARLRTLIRGGGRWVVRGPRGRGGPRGYRGGFGTRSGRGRGGRGY
ncbi:hypothetical protein DFH09DRAFT_1094913 [Mycena vulgaris]|nr:hypothetical protein DFH09DRAFT_1094913 [Mycena vulgaris]